jgi:hypothetical protein
MKNIKITELEVEVRYDLSVDQLVQEANFDGDVNENVK